MYKNLNKLNQMGSESCIVTFQYETDGRNTFPVQKDFHDFCKQRDLFYAIKEIWTTQQSKLQRNPNNNTSFDPAFGKMRALFQLNSSPTNMNRLASLFLSQCVLDSLFRSNQASKAGFSKSAFGGATVGHQTSQAAENNIRKFLQSNPSRLEQLRSRVLPNPEASQIDFVQINDPIAFLKYFTGSAATPSSFSQYLIDSAIHELSEIETTIETEGPPSDLKDILDLIQKAVLLGKMLGYLFYIPYRTNVNGKSTALSFEQQAALRCYQMPPLDMRSIILRSVSQRRTVLTVPWIAELLAQADPAVQYLPKYKPIFKLISLLHQHLKDSDRRVSSFHINPENRRFISLIITNVLGTLIEGKENISPDIGEQLNNALMNCDKSEVGELSVEQLDSYAAIGSSLIPVYFATQPSISIQSVDEFPLLSAVPESPFPDRVNKPKPSTVSNIQEILEAQFYKIHPPSMKKTVEFVSERVASNFVKNLRNHLILCIKQELDASDLTLEAAVGSCKDKIKIIQGDFCTERCAGSLKLLLDENLHDGVKKTCVDFAIKKADEKVTKWVEQHITKELFPAVDKDGKFVKINKAPKPGPSTSDAQTMESNEAEETLGRYKALMLLQSSCKKLFRGQELSSEIVDEILKNIQIIHTYKTYIKNSIIHFIISIIAFQPHSFTETQEANFIQDSKTFFWNVEEDSCKILCSRNFMLFKESKQPEVTWKKFSSLVKCMLSNGMLTFTKLQESCMAVLRQDWPQDVTENLSNMLSSLDIPNNNSEETSIINWVEWVYSGRENESC